MSLKPRRLPFGVLSVKTQAIRVLIKESKQVGRKCVVLNAPRGVADDPALPGDLASSLLKEVPRRDKRPRK
jgi:hypothetical protein